MSIHTLTLDNLENLDLGKVALALDQQIKRIAVDCLLGASDLTACGHDLAEICRQWMRDENMAIADTKKVSDIDLA